MKRLLTLVGVLVAAAFALPAQAALTFTLSTGKASTSTQDVTFDSNQCPALGPRSGYVGGTIANTGASTVTDVTATLSGLNNSFALVHSSTAAQSLGALNAGESISVYWHVTFPCTSNAQTTPTVAISSSLGSQNSSVTLNAKKAISANAGGQVTSATLGPGAVVGQVVYYDTVFTFGSSGTGDEIILQPAGNTSFDSACFRLSRTEIRASTITGVPAGTLNKLYFTATSSNGNRTGVTVRYSFQYLCANTSTTARPYAQLTSGTQLKYTGNYDGSGSISISYPGATNPFTITKTASESVLLSGAPRTVAYTVTIGNPSAHETYLGKITDTLPTGVSYGSIASGSDVTAANSSSVPSAGATGTIVFTGKPNQSYALSAGGSVALNYTATIPGTAGTYTNNAYGTFGTSTATPTASATVTISDPQALILTKTSAAHSDPVNTTTNAKMIPGGVVTYSIEIANPNIVALDTDSVVVTDPTVANLSLVVADFGTGGLGPVAFADGMTSSALSYSFISLASQIDDIDFSNDGGATWTYVPSPDANGADAYVNRIRIRPRGAMAPGSRFNLHFRYRID